MTVDDVFNQDDEATEVAKKRKLVPLVYEEEKKPPIIQLVKPTTAEEKRKCIKNLIEKIPTAKEELFAYSLDWTMVDVVSVIDAAGFMYVVPIHEGRHVWS